MALNYFSPFLLTNLLLEETLKADRAFEGGKRLIGEPLPGETRFRQRQRPRAGWELAGLEAYGRSKLALVMFTYEMSRRLAGTGVTCNCLHPGAVRPTSGLTRKLSAHSLGSRLSFMPGADQSRDR